MHQSNTLALQEIFLLILLSHKILSQIQQKLSSTHLPINSWINEIFNKVWLLIQPKLIRPQPAHDQFMSEHPLSYQNHYHHHHQKKKKLKEKEIKKESLECRETIWVRRRRKGAFEFLLIQNMSAFLIAVLQKPGNHESWWLEFPFTGNETKLVNWLHN